MNIAWNDVRSWWERHDGLDGGIRFLGAAAVVITIETLAGYYLWRGTTESVLIPPALGWALQFGLTGGSVVGTRAFHRGQSEDKWWGFAASVFAVLCVVVDASVAALLLNGLVHLNAGLLAVGVLVECLIVGYLTVHTLMARPRSRTTTVPQANQDNPTEELPRVDETTVPVEIEDRSEPVRPQLTSVGWSVDQIVADLLDRGDTDVDRRGFQRMVRDTYSVGPAKADKVKAELPQRQKVAS